MEKSEWQRTEITGENTFKVWPTLGSRTMEEQNMQPPSNCLPFGQLLWPYARWYVDHRVGELGST